MEKAFKIIFTVVLFIFWSCFLLIQLGIENASQKQKNKKIVNSTPKIGTFRSTYESLDVVPALIIRNTT